MDNQSLWYLENIDMSMLLCPNKMSKHDEQHAHKEFKRGEYIYLPDEDANKIFFIVEGRVKVGTISDAGKEITKAVLGAGEVFGELAIAGASKRRDFAYVMEKTKTCVIEANQLQSLLRDHSALNLFFMNIMGSRVLEMEKRLEALVFKDSRSRIVEFLADLAQKKGKRIGYETEVRKFLTHQEIANLTATSRQTVTTTLNELKTKNIITFNRRRLLVRDLEKLKAESV